MPRAPHSFDSRRLRSLALHALFIGIIFVLPEALIRVAIPDRTLDISWPMYAKSCITIGVFYLNYFLVVPHTLLVRPPRRLRFIIVNVAVIIIGAVAIWFIYRYLYSGPRGRHLVSSLASISYIVRDAAILVLAVALAVALRVSQRWLELERRNEHRLSHRRQSELQGLRQQLNPHFLFNTLNTIYALIAISPDQAQKAIHSLSGMLRYVVYENPKLVELDSEIECVENYVGLMKLRMGNRPVSLTVRRSDGNAARIAPLMIVTLVENAFKHGNTSDTSLPIDIDISADEGCIRCITANHTDEAVSTDGDRHIKGVGLSNLKRRINLLYGKDGHLHFACSADGTFTASLSIPWDIDPENL